MPDETTINPGEMPNEQPSGEMPSGGNQPSLAEIQVELERTRKALADANKEAADRRKKLEKFEKADEERKLAEMTELEKAQKRLAELEQAGKQQAEQVNGRLIKAEVRGEAGRMGFKDLNDAYALADLSGVAVDADGNVTGVEDALKALAKSKPYLLGGEAPRPPAPNTDAGQGNQPRSGGNVLSAGEQSAVQIAQQLGYKIDPEKVAARKSPR